MTNESNNSIQGDPIQTGTNATHPDKLAESCQSAESPQEGTTSTDGPGEWASVDEQLPRPSWWVPYTPARQPVAWLGAVGGSLVLAAAGAGAAARWGNVGIGTRVSVLLCVHMIVVVVSERMRRSVPIASKSLAHLGASLAVPSVIALAAYFESSWRTCIAIAGFVGVAALEVQAKRWNARLLRGGEVAAVALGAAGVAAITHAPVGVLLGGAAVAVYELGLRKRAAALAGAAALTPVLALLATFNVGPGTINELGARGPVLAWGAPLASVLGAVVLGLEAKRRKSTAYAAAAVGALTLGGAIASWYLRFVQIPDDAVAAVVIGAIAVIEWFRLRSGKQVGIPFVVSSLMGVFWSVARCLEDPSVTRLSATLALGMVAVGLGVLRRLNAVAASGALLCASTILLASKDRLTGLPTWVWAMTGGIVLLAAAIGLERRIKRNNVSQKG